MISGNGVIKGDAGVGVQRADFDADALGLRLFNRSTLTGAGAYYLERALPIVAEARLLHGALDEMRETVQGVLRVSLPVDMAYNMVAPLLPEFAVRHPQLRIDFDVTPRKVDLIGEPFDLAVRTGKLPDSDYIATPLAEFSGCLYIAPSYLAERGEPQSPNVWRRTNACASVQTVQHGRYTTATPAPRCSLKAASAPTARA